MRIIGLPAIPGFASGNWRLERSQAAAFNPFGKTRDRTEFDGAVWRGALACPKYNDDAAAVFETWLDQVSEAGHALYISPPQNELRGAWSTPELVSNGGFEGGVTTGWTGTGATLSINSRRLKVKNSGAAIGYARQTLTVQADKAYVLLVDLHPGNVEAWRLRLLDGADAEEHVSYYDQAGRVPIVHIPSSTTLKVELGCNTAVSGDDVKFANVRAARCLLVDDSLAVGNELAVKQGPVSTNAALKVGQFVTIRLWNGWQMVRLTEDLDTDANGKGVLKFQPALRDGVLGGGPVVVHAPFMRATLEAPVSEGQLEPPNFRGMAVDFLEDPTELDDEVPQDTDLIWDFDANSFGLAPVVGSGTPSVARAGVTATYVDSDGLIKTAAANAARFTFDPVVKAVRGLLVEEARTNLLLHSNDFSNAAWASSGTPALAQDQVGRDGLTSAWTVTDDDAAANEGKQQSVVVANDSATYAYTVGVKKTTGATTFPGVLLQFNGGVQVAAQAVINTNTGAGTATSGTLHIQDGGDFWIVTLVASNNSSGNTSMLCGFRPAVSTDSGSATFNVATKGSAVFTTAQAELGAFATSYIPTTSAAVTRNADVITLATASIPGFSEAALTMFAEAYSGAEISTQRYLVSLNDGSSGESINLRFISTRARGSLFDGAVLLADIDAGVITANTLYRLAMAVAANDAAASLNGAGVVTDNTLTMPSPTTLRVGVLTSGSYANTPIRKLRLYKRRKPYRQLMSLSA